MTPRRWSPKATALPPRTVSTLTSIPHRGLCCRTSRFPTPMRWGGNVAAQEGRQLPCQSCYSGLQRSKWLLTSVTHQMRVQYPSKIEGFKGLTFQQGQEHEKYHAKEKGEALVVAAVLMVRTARQPSD